MRERAKDLNPNSPLLNTYFKVVFTPKNKEEFGGRRRFLIGIYSLHKYVGENNANTAILVALNSLEDSCHKTFRTRGTVEFYNK